MHPWALESFQNIFGLQYKISKEDTLFSQLMLLV